MGVKYLWDTNTAIYFLQQQFPAEVEKYIDEIFEEAQPCISAITEIELLCWRAASERDILVLNNFIDYSFVAELEKEIKAKTIYT